MVVVLRFQGPRMVRDVFRLARENSPAIVFIDEVDAIATKRFDAQTGADREVQRILLELLNQMDGFDQTTNVKVIMATNRADTLDPAILRPGRLDRKVRSLAPWHTPTPSASTYHGARVASLTTDRVPPPRPSPEAPRVPGVYRQDEPVRGGGPRGLREPP